eukprot:gnl/MRDRNA2_/MRDRNA2_61866_c0_seq1.p1 gnl/MRDRNA2_/MRDRNA2_61866_c0~~gnl/MRDRNA2_/MRDRNA2_61866_c0_seq1.p1  ORF type:complete len:279 (+),score=82.76 gnl/MRDRNA2_/MRDRNA2_61866_c0_seq1:125-838(+)
MVDTLVNVARAHRDSGDRGAANRIVQDAEGLLPKTASRQHIFVLSLKADLLREEGHLEQAEQSIREALMLQEDMLEAEETPELADQLNILGSVLHDKKNFQEAINLYFWALKINLKTLGKMNPETAATYSNIATAHQDAGEAEQAENYYKEALEIQKVTVGENNPDVAASYNNIATLFLLKNKFKEAHALTMKAIKIVKATGMPPEHPEHMKYQENLMHISRLVEAAEMRANAINAK